MGILFSRYRLDIGDAAFVSDLDQFERACENSGLGNVEVCPYINDDKTKEAYRQRFTHAYLAGASLYPRLLLLFFLTTGRPSSQVSWANITTDFMTSYLRLFVHLLLLLN